MTGDAGRLVGKVVLITGSTRGLGRDLALHCAASGARVAVTGRTEQAGMEVVRTIAERGSEAIYVRCDVTSGACEQAPTSASIM